MVKKLRITTLILFSIMLISINFSISFSQKEGVNKSSRIEGIISAVEGNILEISKGAIKIDISGASIRRESRRKEAVILEPGMYVKIYDYETSGNGGFLERTVMVGQSTDEGLIIGEILNLDYKAKKLRVFNQEIVVSEETGIRILGKERKTNEFSKLEVSKSANVLLSKQGEKLFAEEISQFDDWTPSTYSGIYSGIEEVEGERIKILNNFYIKTNNFSIKSLLESGPNCKDVEVSTLKKGMFIRIRIEPENIKYGKNGDITYIAKTKDKIINKFDVYLEDEGVIEGVAEEINVDQLKVKVAGQEIVIDKETIIVKDSQKFSFTNISTNERMFLVYKVIEGELRARYIKLIKDGYSLIGYNPCNYN